MMKFKKIAACFILVSFIFGTVSPVAAAVFKTISNIPQMYGTGSVVIYYQGMKWARYNNTTLFKLDSIYKGNCDTAISRANGYISTLTADGVSDWEKNIASSTRLMKTNEAKALPNNTARNMGHTYWLYDTSSWRDTVDNGGGVRGNHWKASNSFYTHPFVLLKNTGTIYFLSANSGGAKAAGLGTITTEESTTQYKITYKDASLAAPTVGGGALILDASGISSWYTDTENRVAASVGNADALAADGYMLMQNAGADHKLVLGGSGNYNGEGELYLHQEISTSKYDLMGTDSLKLSDLGLNLTYADSKLKAMTLPQLYGTAENTISLNNGFKLTLAGDNYAQNITALSGGGTLISNSSETTLSGNTSLTGILTYDGQYLNTGTISGSGGLNILATSSLKTDAGKTQTGSGITNNGQLTLTGGSDSTPAVLASAVTGAGTTNIAGTIKANLELATKTIVEAGEKLIIDPDDIKGALKLDGSLYSGSDVITKHTPDPSTLATVETDDSGYFGVNVSGIGKAIINHDVAMSNTAGFGTAYFMDLTCAEKYKLKVADLIAGGKTPAEAQAEAYPLLVPAYIDDLTFASATGSQRYILYKMQTEGIKEKYKVTAAEAAAASADPRFAGLEAGDYRPILPMSYISADVNAKMSVGEGSVNSGALVDLNVGTNGHIDLVNNQAGGLIAKNFTASDGSQLSFDIINDDVMDSFLVMENASGNLALGTVNVLSELMTRTDSDGWYIDAEGNYLDKNGQITTDPSQYINPKQLMGANYVTSWRDIPIYGIDNLSIADTSSISGKYLYTISYVENPGQANDKQLKIVKTVGYTLREILQGYVEQRVGRELKRDFHAATVASYPFYGDMINQGAITVTTKDTGETVTLDIGGGNLGILTRKDAGGTSTPQDDNGYGTYMEDSSGKVIGLDPAEGRGGKLGGSTARTFSINGNSSRLYGGGCEGITIQEGDTLKISGISLLDDFKDGTVVKNDGTFEILTGGTVEIAPGVQQENTLLLNASMTNSGNKGKLKINGADVVLGANSSDYTFEYDVYKTKPVGVETQEVVSGDTSYFVHGYATGKTTCAPVTINQDKIEIIQGSLTANASQLTLTSGIENTGGTLNFTGGENNSKITGIGILNIMGDVQNNVQVTQKKLNIAESGKLTSDASQLTISDSINDSGELNLTGGENNNRITGAGILNITGDVQNNAAITLQAINTTAGNTLTNIASAEISAANLTGTIVNKENGTITAENADVTLTNSGEFTAENLKGTVNNKASGIILAETVNEADVTNAGQFSTNAMTGSLKNKACGTAVITGTYDGTIENSGEITAGTLKGTTDNKETGTITANTVDEADVTNAGQFSTNAMTGSLKNKACGTAVITGTYDGTIENSGEITAGTLKGTTDNKETGIITANIVEEADVTNAGQFSINAMTGSLKNKAGGTAVITGTYDGTIENSGEINAGTMKGTIDNKETGTIDAARISSAISENAGKITVTDLDSATANNSGEINLSNLNGGTINNSGTVNVLDGKLEGAINGSGITNIISGAVENLAKIAQDIAIKAEAVFTTNLDKLKGENVTNEGETIITGGSTAAGFTNSGAVTFAEGVNNAQIAAGKTTFSDTAELNFVLNGHKHQDTILTSSDSENFDISAVPKENINLIHNGKGSILKVPGEYIVLINGVNGYNGSSSRNNPDTVTAIDSEKALTGYLYDMYSFQNDLYAAYHDITVLERAKSLSEGRMAAISAINNASDLIADRVAHEISTLENNGTEWTSFVSIQGNHGHYTTGSYIDMNGSSVAAGLAKKVSANTTIGIFAEGGWSHYNSTNKFNNFGTVTAKGDVNHFGGGILLKTEADPTDKGSLHGEVSVRAGHSSQDYSSENLLPASRIDYNSGSRYLAAHATVGYNHKLTSGNTVDTYVKYLYAHLGGDDTTLSFTNEEINFKPIESHRVRAGFRYNKTVDADFKAYGGLAYEYEFSNNAAATTQGLPIAEPDLKGGTGVAELGVKYHKTGNPWQIEFSVTGTTGKRDSIGANLGATYEFGNKNTVKAKPVKQPKEKAKAKAAAESKQIQVTEAGTKDFDALFGNRYAEVKQTTTKAPAEQKKTKTEEQPKSEKEAKSDKPNNTAIINPKQKKQQWIRKTGQGQKDIQGIGILDLLSEIGE